ncbi:nucleoside phosphorylase [Microbulbifer rhizosphaerae]|uniref:Nucleoside phosphorylase n=1 Tax=Microbulbifer rhizosphaerae TaxID=1562603 RepID=A0A7W4WD06_9GAMM|nr:nucleoside phosphorylase [Microbulbifer rhizosphaerae]
MDRREFFKHSAFFTLLLASKGTAAQVARKAKNNVSQGLVGCGSAGNVDLSRYYRQRK